VSVSVIIPTYYRARDLADLFESLLRQTVKPLEVIVVDGTPMDEVERVCSAYRYRFRELGVDLIYIRNPRTRSAAVARNVGAEIARGDILLFVDSDIVLYPDYIEKILEVFKQIPSALGVQGWIVNLRYPRNHFKFAVMNTLWKPFGFTYLTYNSCKYNEYPIILDKIISCEWLGSSNMALRRSVFEEFRFDENLTKYSFMEDRLLSLSIHREYPGTLYITPHAKCIHKYSEEGRLENRGFTVEHPHLRACRKYVLAKLFGIRGYFLLAWQTLGLVVLKLVDVLAKAVKRWALSRGVKA